MNTTAEVDCPIVKMTQPPTAEPQNDATAETVKDPETNTEKFITVAEAKQKLDWEDTPAYKQTLLRLAYMANERRNNKPKMSATAWHRRKAKLRKEKASRKRNRH